MSLSTQYPATVPSLLLDFANTKRLDPRITFARASTARYYDGKTFAKAEENLLLWSQEFDNGWWNKLRTTTATNSVAAPDGTTTAETLIETTETGTHRAAATGVFTTANADVTVSVFLKDNTRQYAIVGCASAAVGNRWFAVTVDLVAGTITQTGAGAGGTYIASSITSVGNGWYRVVVTGRIGASTDAAFNVQMSDSGTPTILDFMAYSYAGSTANSYYVWGAQLEQRSAATAYTATTTQQITRYQPQLLTAAANVARFGHNPVTGESLGLLIEESRSNLLTFTEDFANAAWATVQSSITVNTAIAPDGTLTADQVVENTATAVRSVSRATAGSAGTAGAVFTGSVYVKAAGRNIVQVRAILGTTAYGVEINLTSGAVSAVAGETPTSFSATNVGNGWYRVALTGTAGATTGLDLMVRPCSAAGVTSYTGDGYSGVFIWGAQLEAGAFPTSYIARVDATAASRAADAASMTGTNFSSWYRADEGTLFADSIRTGAALTSAFIADGTLNNYISLYSNTSGVSIAQVQAGGVSQAVWTSGATTSGAPFKAALAYKTNDFAYVFNGGTANVDTSGVLPVVDRLGIAQFTNGSGFGNGYLRKLAYYPTRLTNAQLQALTR